MLQTVSRNTLRFSARAARVRSAGLQPRVASTTSTAMSQFSSSARARATRRFPSSPASSMPGVSTITTGPKGKSSIDLRTGSVVVPLTCDTTETFCAQTAFTKLDLPALRRPKKAIRVRSAEGVSLRLMGTT